MASASPQQKFELGVGKVRGLRARAVASADGVNEAWSALRTGVVASRKAPESLDRCEEGERPRILEFVLERGAQKKSARGQVKECLRILLVRPVWLASVLAEEGLRAGVVEALDASQDAELLAQLLPPAQPQAVEESVEAEALEASQDAEPLAQLPPPARPRVGEESAEAEAEAAVGEAEAALIEVEAEAPPRPAKPRPLSIHERMARGRAVLEGFGWAFPRDPTGTRGDEATAGFMLLFEAVTLLSTGSGLASVGGEPSAVLAGWEEDLANLLHFLLSMYTSGVRRTYSGRIRFVVVRLRALAPAFRELAPWASLPWGHEEMPKEEAEAEARVLEDLQRQRAEEAEDERLARMLQEEEEKEALAREKVRRERAQEDFVLACKLQNQGCLGWSEM